MASLSTSIILGVIASWFHAAVVPFFFQFWAWIAGGAAAVFAFLFSPKIRKYTIGVLLVLAVLGGVWTWGYVSGHGNVASLCDNPKFHKIVLPRVTGKYPLSVIAQVNEHNALGAGLGCWK